MELSEKIEQLGKAFEAFKTANNEKIEQLQSKGAVDPILEEKAEKANKEVERLNTEVEELKSAFNRPRFDEKDSAESKYTDYKNLHGLLPGFFTKDLQLDTKAVDLYEASLEKFVRKGESFLSNEEMKALSVGSDPDGGYFVRPQVSNQIIEKMFETSPIRQVASAQTITVGDSLEIPVDFDEASSGWVGEQGSRSSTDTPEVGMKKIYAHEQYAMPVATQRMLDDAGINVEAWLSGKVQDKLSRTENTAFVSGDGVEKPRGLTTYASGTGYDQVEQFTATASGSAALDDADDLIEVFFKLKQTYRANATWLMERATQTAVRKLKGTDGNYLWQPGLAAGTPASLLGRPILEADDMASIGANALAVAVGDFRRGYQIIDKAGLRVLRDPYSSKGKVQFYTTKRVGGDVANGEAIKLLKLKS